jgi:hypothetical protein
MKEFILVYLVRKYAIRANILMFSNISLQEIRNALKTAKSEYKAGSEKELIQQVIKICIINFFASKAANTKNTN